MYVVHVDPEVGPIELIGSDPPNPPETGDTVPASESFDAVMREVSDADKAPEALPDQDRATEALTDEGEAPEALPDADKAPEALADQDETPPGGEAVEVDAEESVETNLDAVVAVMVLFQGEAADAPPQVVSEAVVGTGTSGEAETAAQVTDANPAVSRARYQVLPSSAQAAASEDTEVTGANASGNHEAVSEQQGDVLKLLDVPEEQAEASVAAMLKGRALGAGFEPPETLAPVATDTAAVAGTAEEADTALRVARPGQGAESTVVPQVVARTTEVVQEPQGAAIIERVTVNGLSEYTVKSVRHLVTDGGGKLTVRLVPESLGEMHLEVSSVRDSVMVRLVSQNPVVRETLEAQLTGLRDALAREGIDVARVTVSADVGAGHSGPNSESRQQAQFDHAPRYAGASGNGHGAGDSSSRHETRWKAPSHGGALNLFA